MACTKWHNRCSLISLQTTQLTNSRADIFWSQFNPLAAEFFLNLLALKEYFPSWNHVWPWVRSTRANYTGPICRGGCCSWGPHCHWLVFTTGVKQGQRWKSAKLCDVSSSSQKGERLPLKCGTWDTSSLARFWRNKVLATHRRWFRAPYESH